MMALFSGTEQDRSHLEACLDKGLILKQTDLTHTDPPDETKLQLSGRSSGGR